MFSFTFHTILQAVFPQLLKSKNSHISHGFCFSTFIIIIIHILHIQHISEAYKEEILQSLVTDIYRYVQSGCGVWYVCDDVGAEVLKKETLQFLKILLKDLSCDDVENKNKLD